MSFIKRNYFTMTIFLQYTFLTLLLISPSIKTHAQSKEILKHWVNYFPQKMIPSTSMEFDYQSKNSSDEINYLIKNHSTLKCHYPFKYSVLSHLKLIDQVSFSDCKDLNLFSSSLNKKNVSLLYASESFSSPASIFGHISIVFHNEIIPELDSDVIHFSAIQQSNDFTNNIMGVSGGLRGYFIKDKFHKKFHEYLIVEKRNINLWTIKLNKKELDLFFYQLYELKYKFSRYYFVTNNCSTQLYVLLKNSRLNSEELPWILTPTDVIRRNNDILEPSITLSPYYEVRKANKLSSKEKLLDTNTNENLPQNLQQYSYDQNKLVFKNKFNSRIGLFFNMKNSSEWNFEMRPTHRDHFDYQAQGNNNVFNLLETFLNYDTRSKSIILKKINFFSIENHPIDQNLYFSSWKINTYYNNEKKTSLDFNFQRGENFKIISNDFNLTFFTGPKFQIFKKDSSLIYLNTDISFLKAYGKLKLKYSFNILIRSKKANTSNTVSFGYDFGAVSSFLKYDNYPKSQVLFGIYYAL